MNIALDYDGTYTRDPQLWADFINNALALGHKIVCVTMRFPEESISMPIEVIYTSRLAKGVFMANIGRYPDVWIDDMPHLITMDAAR